MFIFFHQYISQCLSLSPLVSSLMFTITWKHVKFQILERFPTCSWLLNMTVSIFTDNFEFLSVSSLHEKLKYVSTLVNKGAVSTTMHCVFDKVHINMIKDHICMTKSTKSIQKLTNDK